MFRFSFWSFCFFVYIAVYFGNALIINGRNEFVGQSKELTYLGDVIQYTKSTGVETLVIAGPTHRRYDVTVYVPGHTSSVPFIDYLYYSRVVIPALNYRWRSEPMECTCTVGWCISILYYRIVRQLCSYCPLIHPFTMHSFIYLSISPGTNISIHQFNH